MNLQALTEHVGFDERTVHDADGEMVRCDRFAEHVNGDKNVGMLCGIDDYLGDLYDLIVIRIDEILMMTILFREWNFQKNAVGFTCSLWWLTRNKINYMLRMITVK